jgi:SAM-dependent methyltransferase
MSETAAARYVMGHNDRERRRLMLQASVLNPLTEQLFRRAGIGPGMRVLDIGSGVGDVAMISARLGASVTAVDPEALTIARERAYGEGLNDIAFVTSDVHSLDLPQSFDAITGRHILIHVPDPAELLRDGQRFLKPGGVAVFQEYDFSVVHPSYPACPLRDETMRIFREFFARVGKPHMGSPLFGIFTDAGFSAPQCRVEYPMFSWEDGVGYEIFAEAVRSILARAEALGVVRAAEVDIDTLEQRLREEGMTNKSACPMPAMVGGFATRM